MGVAGLVYAIRESAGDYLLEAHVTLDDGDSWQDTRLDDAISAGMYQRRWTRCTRGANPLVFYTRLVNFNADTFQAVGDMAILPGSTGPATGSSLLTCATAPDLTSDVHFTLTFWFKPHLNAAPTINVFLEFIDQLNVRVGFKTGETNAFISATTPSLTCDTGNVITPDVWHMAQIYFDGVGLYISVDMVDLASDAGASTGIVAVSDALEIELIRAFVMDIDLDEVAYWVGASALSVKQRATLYNWSAGGRPQGLV
jgi:hypothetical protein